MADRWENTGRCWWLKRDGKVIGSVMRSFAQPGRWCAQVTGVMFSFFPTRAAAVRAVTVEAASNKRCGAAG